MSGVGCLGSVCAGLWLTDSCCLRSWLTLTPSKLSVPPQNLFLPLSFSVFISNKHTVFLSLFSPCSLSCVFFVSVLHTCAFFIFPSPSPSGLYSCDPVPLPLRHSQRCCQGARRRPDRDVRKQILPGALPNQPQSATMVISPSRPRQSSQSSHPGQAIAANAVQFCHSRRPRHGQNQHDHRRDLIQDAFSDSTIQHFRSTQTRPHKPRHGQIITNQFSCSQT